MPMPADFDAEVYAIIAQIPIGSVATYGQIAQLLGMPNHSRRVGRAMTDAPAETPCHRVVNAQGRTAPGWPEQRTLLEQEGVRFKSNGCANLRQCGWEEIR